MQRVVALDVDRFRHRLQYHAVAVPAGDPERVRDAINGPVERLVARLEDDGGAGPDADADKRAMRGRGPVVAYVAITRSRVR